MKIFMGILILTSACLALPTGPGHKLSKKEVASGSDNGSRLVGTTTENISTVSPDLNSKENPTNVTDISSAKEKEEQLLLTEKPTAGKNESNIPKTKSRILTEEDDTSIPFHSNEFKVKILDLNHPTKLEATKTSHISIGSSLYPLGDHNVNIPELYVIKTPHFVVLKESDFLNNHPYAARSVSDLFQPFQDIPSLTQDFGSSEDNLFGISDVSSIYPIQIPNEQYPIIGGGDNIPVISDIGGISQGVEILQPESIGSVGFADEKIEYESDSITVDALERLSKIFKEFKIATRRNEEDSPEQKQELNDKKDSKKV